MRCGAVDGDAGFHRVVPGFVVFPLIESRYEELDRFRVDMWRG
jgi:hypothetical protein